MQSSVIACCLSLALSGAAAQAAPSKIPSQNFARPSEYAGAEISPTGEYVSVITPFESRHGLTLIKLSGNYERSLIKFNLFNESAAEAAWTDDSRLIVMKAKEIGSLTAPQLNGDVYAVNADGSDNQQIFGYVEDNGNRSSKLKDRGNVSYIRHIPGSKGEALFSYSPWLSGNSKFITALYRVNTHTGKRTQVESVDGNVSIVADTAATARLIWAEDIKGEPWMLYRPAAGGGEWQPVPAGLAGRWMGISAFEPDNQHAYAWISDAGEPKTLYRADLAAGTRQRLAGNPEMDVDHVMLAGYEGLPFAVVYTAGKPKIEYTNPGSDWAKLHSGLMKVFPGQMVEFENFTKDNNKVLFFVYSDRHPGAYYIFDRTTHTPSLLFETREWIDPATQAPTLPVQFQNASGQSLFAFYTAPLGKTGPQPLIVMAHGGPFGVHDTWGYDSDVQFLASRGYGVLQVNYRGSSGRGEKFERSTYQQWGSGIQDDIRDAVRWAIGQKLADAGKVCTFGISFGGYSALMNPIRNPGMYRCAIGYAGVYDLAQVSEQDYMSKQTKAFFERTMGADKAKLASQSPAKLAAQIDVPVLLIHGKADHVAPFAQYEAMSGALAHANKPYETLVKASEGHGFFEPKNRTEVYNRIEAFLLKYNPTN